MKKQRQCQGKLNLIINSKLARCEAWLWHFEKKLCYSCLLRKFGLTDGEYDSCDREGIGELLYRQDDVVMALRKASKL